MNLVFSLSSLLVMPFWFLMIFLPRWKYTKTIIGSPYIIVPAVLLYALLIIPNIEGTFMLLLNPNLEGISKLLGSSSGATVPSGCMTGWSMRAMRPARPGAPKDCFREQVGKGWSVDEARHVAGWRP